VNRHEAVTVGKNRTKQVGQTERVTVGQHQNISVGINRVAQVGNNDTKMVGVQHMVMITPPGEGAVSETSSSYTITDKKIVLDTGAGATITMDHDKITIIADDLVEIWGKKRGVNLHAPAQGGQANVFTGDKFSVDCKTVSISAKDQLKILGKDVNIIGTSTAHLTGGSEVTVTGGATATLAGGTANVTGKGTTNVSGGIVLINGPGLFAGRVTDPAVGTILRGSSTVLIGGTQFPFDVTRDGNGNLHVGPAIVIKGDAAFQDKVLARLGQISNTPSGMKTLNTIEGSGHTMNISEFKGDNSFCGPTTNAGFADATAAGQPVFDGAGNPVLGPDGKQMVGTGKGTDTNMQLNPDLTLANSQDPSNPVPNDAVAFHEMTHGAHEMTGTYDGSPTPGFDTNEEKQTISTGNPSEASYLKDTGYPWQRTDHDSTFAPNP
jgi:hypothetical protein